MESQILVESQLCYVCGGALTEDGWCAECSCFPDGCDCEAA